MPSIHEQMKKKLSGEFSVASKVTLSEEVERKLKPVVQNLLQEMEDILAAGGQKVHPDPVVRVRHEIQLVSYPSPSLVAEALAKSTSFSNIKQLCVSADVDCLLRLDTELDRQSGAGKLVVEVDLSKPAYVATTISELAHLPISYNETRVEKYLRLIDMSKRASELYGRAPDLESSIP